MMRTFSSEYSSKVIGDDPVAKEEKSRARKELYKALFREPITWLGTFFSVVIGVMPPIFIYLSTDILDAITDWETSIYKHMYYPEYYKEIYDPMPLIVKQIKKMSGVIVAQVVCQFFITMLWTRIGSIVIIKIKSAMFTNMMRSEVCFFDVNPVGDVLTLLSEDAESVELSFGKVKGVQMSAISQGIVGLVFGLWRGYDVALIALVCVPIIGLILVLLVPSILRHSAKKFQYTSNSMTIAEETLASVRTVRGFNREAHEIERFTKETRGASMHDKSIGLIITFFLFCVLICVVANLLSDFYYGANLVEDGKLTLGELITVFMYTCVGSLSIISLQGTMQGEQKAIASGSRIMKVTHYQSSIEFDGGITIPNFKGNIEFRNVSFKYPTRDAYVLKNVSFTINQNQTGALVGHSGSGKSTCVQLLERFYDANEGQVLLDGHDIKTIDQHWLHKQIALVSQEPILFRCTIAENLRYGNKDATQEELEHAIDVANATKILSKLEKGYDTLAGDKGTSLSGGQRQRIAIARAVLMKPRILICDEATSALDAQSEKKVQVALDKVMEDCTAVIVAHRLSTIRNANIIYVFDAGEILEVGTHDELVKKKGAYYNLVYRQLSNKETDEINGNKPANNNDNDEEDEESDKKGKKSKKEDKKSKKEDEKPAKKDKKSKKEDEKPVKVDKKSKKEDKKSKKEDEKPVKEGKKSKKEDKKPAKNTKKSKKDESSSSESSSESSSDLESIESSSSSSSESTESSSSN